MRTIKTNKCTLTIDVASIDRKFGFLKVTLMDGKYGWKSAILDDFQDGKGGVRSLCFRKGAIWVMTEADRVDEALRTISVHDTKEHKTIERTSSSDILKNGGDYILAQLLVNALPGIGRSDELRTINLTGRTQFHHSAWKNRDGHRKPIYVVLDANFSEDMCLNLEVGTYSALPKGFDIKGRPVYQLDNDGRMKRCYDLKQKGLFIKKRFDEEKSEIPFLCVQDEAEFLKSKMGILQRMMSQFSRVYGGIATLSFVECETLGYDKLRGTEERIKGFRRAEKSSRDEWIASHQNIYIRDLVQNEDSLMLRKELIRGLEFYGFHIADVSSDNILEIRIIHCPEWYSVKNIEDPHVCERDFAIQHIEVETLVANGHCVGNGVINNVIQNCINNIIIKDDLVHNKVSLVWRKVYLEKPMSFGVVLSEGKNENEKLSAIIMDINTDWTFNMSKRLIDPFTDEKGTMYSHLSTRWEDGMVGLVQMGQSLIAIKNTEMYTIPENDIIQEEMRSHADEPVKCKISRGKESRDRLLSAVTDINLFQLDGSTYFNVGLVGAGMNTTVQRGSIVREFKVLMGEDFSETLLAMLVDAHIRNEQYTVIPFAFKYLNEYSLLVESE